MPGDLPGLQGQFGDGQSSSQGTQAGLSPGPFQILVSTNLFSARADAAPVNRSVSASVPAPPENKIPS